MLFVSGAGPCWRHLPQILFQAFLPFPRLLFIVCMNALWLGDFFKFIFLGACEALLTSITHTHTPITLSSFSKYITKSMTDIWSAVKAVNIAKHNIEVVWQTCTWEELSFIFLCIIQACLLYAQYLYTVWNIQIVTDGILHHVLCMIHSLWGVPVCCLRKMWEQLKAKWYHGQNRFFGGSEVWFFSVTPELEG